MIAIPQGKWARPGLVSGARTFVLHEVGSVSSTTPKNCVQGPAVEVRTTLHYLALDQRFRSSNHIRPVELVGPGVNDGLSIEEVHCGHDAILEFLF